MNLLATTPTSIAFKAAQHIVPAAHSSMGFDPSLPVAEEDELIEDELLPLELDLESEL